MNTTSKINTGVNTFNSLKGMAKRTYNRVTSAMAEDGTPAMCHTFAALTEGAKTIALQSGHFSNLYIRGERKGMTAEEAAKELTERAAACVSRKLRKIDTICAVAFLTEYIRRQRKREEPTTTEPTNTPATMNAKETKQTVNTGVNTFNTIEDAANYIAANVNTGSETTLNDTICFGMGVYAYKSECRKAGITTSNDASAFHHLNESELLTLLAWLQDNDGYLIAS